MEFELKIREISRVWNFMEFLLGTSDFDDTWAKDFCLHLDDNLTHEKEFHV
jgi:hypothetical protein